MTIKKSLSGRLMVIAGSAIGLTLVGFVGISGWVAAERTNDQILQLAAEKAAVATAQTSVRIVDAVSAGTALTGTLSGLMGSGTVRKADTVAALESLLRHYPDLFGAWMSDTTDKRAAPYFSGTGFENAAGLFTPYWTKKDDGTLAFSTFPVDPAQAWYRDPIASGKSLLVEPYVTSQGQLVTSVSAPLKVGTQVVGVGGVDIRLSWLAEAFAAMRPFDGGRVLMLSNAGKWIVPPQPDLLMKDYDGVGAADIRAALADRRPRILRGSPDGSVRLVYPFTQPGMNTTWSLVMDVPAAAFSHPITLRVAETAAAGFIVLLVLLGVLFLAARRLIRRPLERCLTTIEALIERRYDVAITDTQRGDEIGRSTRRSRCSATRRTRPTS